MNPIQVQIHQDWLKKIKQDTLRDQIAVEKCISRLNESNTDSVKCQDCSARCRTHLKMLGFIVGENINANRTYHVSKPSPSDQSL